jgi:hypothetical protein
MFMHTNIHEHILVHKSIFKQFKIDFIQIISFQFHFLIFHPPFSVYKPCQLALHNLVLFLCGVDLNQWTSQLSCNKLAIFKKSNPNLLHIARYSLGLKNVNSVPHELDST